MATLQDLKNKVHGTLADKGFELRKTDTEEVVELLLDDALGLLVETGELKLGSKWGKFEVVERAARKGINPTLLKELKTQGVSGEEAKEKAQIELPATKAPRFKPSKNLKEVVK